MARWRVGEEEAGARLGDFLRERLGGGAPSARAVKRALERGAGRVNGKTETFPTRALRSGDRVEFDASLLEARAPRLAFEAGRVLHEDDDLLLYDKPAGPPSAPTEGGGLCLYDVLRRFVRKERGADLWMVHRLDAGTSGVMVFVKRRELEPAFRALFAAGEVRKTYLAIALGEIAWRRRRVETRMARVGKDRWGSVASGGQHAATDFERLRPLRGAAEVRARPVTGRTHQIRVHLAELGHPILGDLVYGRDRRQPIVAGRPMLHAAEIAFVHPGTGAPLRAAAPPPEDFRAALAALETTR